MSKNFEGFTRLYPMQRTIRFELVPQGRTMEHLHNSKYLDEDRVRAEKYAILKGTIDEYHKKFIEDCLFGVSLDWAPLKRSLECYRNSSKEDKASCKKILESEQKRMRKEIVSLFEKDERYKDLFSEKLFSKLLPDFIESEEDAKKKELKINALNSFDKFSGYFIGLHENRKNMYSDGDETTAISNRIVNENFPIFLDNLDNYEKVRKEMPEIIQDVERELSASGIKTDEIFSLGYFNEVLKQDGIDRYNLAIGGRRPSEKEEKLRGLNEFLNNRHQKDQSSKKRIRMAPLRKQILSDRDSFSYIPKAFENDSELLSSINNFFIENEKDDMFERALNLVTSYSEYETEKIFVNNKDLSKISVDIFSGWDALGGMLRTFKAKAIGDENLEKTSKVVDKWLNSKEFSLSDILGAIIGSGSEKTFDEYILKMRSLKAEIDGMREKFNKIEGKISGNEEYVQTIKAALDSVLNFSQMLRPFNTSRETSRDTAFYAELDAISDKISAIIPLYDRTRNYLTTKRFNTKKIKLNFKNPTLANGWDVNKEYDNTALIFLRDGKYYLGIMDPRKKNKMKFEKKAGPYYQKMEYKLLPGPNKMLPKVFFSKKNIDYYGPSDEIMDGYRAEKHKKGDKFDINFCHKLIDFFKGSIEKHEDWKKFNFKFSPTESYADISGFYREVEEQGYRLSFRDVSVNQINDHVENGGMFLFQIYNKDFADGRKEGSMKDMHTIYWDAVFSEENLKKIVVKLNGEAELFYRDKSDIKTITHKKGEILVNRKCNDGKTPVPDEIYRELFEHHNGRKKDLSDNAKNYLDKVRVFKATHDITKDYLYTVDKMFFHVPVTLNFKARGKENLNEKVIKKFISDKGARIIGIDRGEKNLIYASVIDRSGKIILQKSFNVIDGFDFHEKLNQRENERDIARKSWDSIGKIKDLKEGYLSKAVHEISKMVIDHNAIVVLEDLNYGFKKGRFKVEKQIYQKFEKMLIDKLNYLVFKDTPNVNDAGGVLNAYQLTEPFVSFNKLGKQSGILFYVNPAYTSKIDPTTGFVDIFNTTGITSMQKKKNFLSQFESIEFSTGDNAFMFSLDYRKFETSKTDHKNKWTVYTNGERIKYSKNKGTHTVDPTKKIKDALSSSGIEYAGAGNIRDKILSAGSDNLIDAVYYSFLDAKQMRNSDGNKDYILSPVKNRKGEFFITDPGREDIPKDSDANGAYNIALKGELLLRMIAEKYDPEKKTDIPKMEHLAWFKFMQTRG